MFSLLLVRYFLEIAKTREHTSEIADIKGSIENITHEKTHKKYINVTMGFAFSSVFTFVSSACSINEVFSYVFCISPLDYVSVFQDILICSYRCGNSVNVIHPSGQISEFFFV